MSHPTLFVPQGRVSFHLLLTSSRRNTNGRKYWICLRKNIQKNRDWWKLTYPSGFGERLWNWELFLRRAVWSVFWQRREFDLCRYLLSETDFFVPEKQSANISYTKNMNSKDVQNSPFVFGHSQRSENAVSVFFMRNFEFDLKSEKRGITWEEQWLQDV